MKKIIITLMLALPMLASAQKFGHINTQELFAQMPEVAQVKLKMDTIQNQYDNKLIVSGTEYLKLASEGKSIEKPEDISKISDKTYPCPQYFSYLLCF